MPQLTLPVDKGWMPDAVPFAAPPGALSDMQFCVPDSAGWKTIPAATEGNNALTGTPYAFKTFVHSSGSTYVFVATSYGTVYRCVKNYPSWTVTTIANASYTYGTSATYSRIIQFGDDLVVLFSNRAPQIIRDFSTATTMTTIRDTASPYEVFPIARFGAYVGHHLVLGHITPAIFRSNTDTAVSISRFEYTVSSVKYTKLATGSLALAAGTIPQDKYGIYLFTVDTSGTITSTAGAANFTTGYSTYTLAVAAKPSVPAGSAEVGTVVVKTKSGATFVGGTDALLGGTSGNVASETVYTPPSSGATSASMLIWSDFESVESMSASASLSVDYTTGSDAQVLYQLEGPITDIVNTGFFDGMIFGRKGILRITYVGGLNTYNISLVDSSVGAIECSVVSTRMGVYFISDFGFYIANYQGVKRIGYGVCDKSLFLSMTSVADIYGCTYDETANSIYWAMYSVPSTRVWILVGYDILLDRFFVADISPTYRILGVAAYFGQGVGVSTLPCGIVTIRYEGGAVKIHGHDTITPTDTAYITTHEFQIPNNKISTIKRVRPKVHGWTTAPSVTVYSRMNEDDSWTASTAKSVDSTSGWADIIQTGRYHKIKTTLGAGTIVAIDVEYTETGDA